MDIKWVYCCDIHIGGIGDMLNYAYGRKSSLKTQQVYNSPQPKIYILTRPNYICK